MTATPEQMIQHLFEHYRINELTPYERGAIFAECATKFTGRDLERAFTVQANAALEKKQRKACHELIDALKKLNGEIMRGGAKTNDR